MVRCVMLVYRYYLFKVDVGVGCLKLLMPVTLRIDGWGWQQADYWHYMTLYTRCQQHLEQTRKQRRAPQVDPPSFYIHMFIKLAVKIGNHCHDDSPELLLRCCFFLFMRIAPLTLGSPPVLTSPRVVLEHEIAFLPPEMGRAIQEISYWTCSV